MALPEAQSIGNTLGGGAGPTNTRVSAVELSKKKKKWVVEVWVGAQQLTLTLTFGRGSVSGDTSFWGSCSIPPFSPHSCSFPGRNRDKDPQGKWRIFTLPALTLFLFPKPCTSSPKFSPSPFFLPLPEVSLNPSFSAPSHLSSFALPQLPPSNRFQATLVASGSNCSKVFLFSFLISEWGPQKSIWHLRLDTPTRGRLLGHRDTPPRALPLGQTGGVAHVIIGHNYALFILHPCPPTCLAS